MIVSIASSVAHNFGALDTTKHIESLYSVCPSNPKIPVRGFGLARDDDNIEDGTTNLGDFHFDSVPILIDLRNENVVISVIRRLRITTLVLA